MKLPYGYVLIGKEIVIHEEKADVVRSIFDDYLAGASLGKIVDLLFKKGVVSPTGKVKWTRAAVDKLLANKKYIPLVGIKIYIGLGSGQEIRMQRLEEQFIAALRSCNKYKEKRTLWIATMTLLNSDPIFANNGASALLTPQGTEDGELVVSAQELFSRLSSGHKVILLTLTCLVAITMERTLVLMDEPENHLHPPLLSAFVRALSALLIQKNGLAIISTHSPVILQEVPKNCIWQLYRNNTILRAVRPERETFGENVGVLINDVFGLEVTHSGFHGMLLQMVEAGLIYEEILNKFDFRVGMEARSILRILLANREYGGTE